MSRGVVLLAMGASVVVAADWPQWRGPDRNGIARESLNLSAWPTNSAPRLAWEVAIGKGHSAPSIAGGRVFVLGWDGVQDTVFCLAEDNGRLLWKQSYPCKTIVQWPGPRSTPTVSGDLVYTLGQHGQLNAWRVATGERVWNRQLAAANQPDDDYGFAWSPFVAGDLLVFPCGEGGLALRKADGTDAWGKGPKHGACASPVGIKVDGKLGLVLLLTESGRNNINLVGIEPGSGRELWSRVPWPEKWGAICTDPVVQGGSVFITSAEQYKQGARFSWRNGKMLEDWRNASLSSYTSGIVLWQNHLYGVDKTGMLKCVDWNTGAERWSQRGFGERGSLILADGRLLVQAGHSGEIYVVEANPAAFRELRRHKAYLKEPVTFTAPVLANGQLYVRNYAGRLMVFDLPAGLR